MNRLFSLLILFASIYLVSCKAYKPEGQGITGTITWVEGNHMPTISDSGNNVKKVAAQAVTRTIKIYPLLKFSDLTVEEGLYTAVAAQPLQTIETDEDGEYSISLPPGRYSVLVVEEGGLFGNIFDGEGNVQPVTVKENQWTLLDIEVNYKAFY